MRRHGRVQAWVVGVTAVVTLLMHIPWLTQSLWYDEVFRTFVMLGDAEAKNLLLYDVHNPLYNGFMYLWIRVVGDGELAVRAPSVIMSYVAAGLMWWWGERRFSRGAGALGAVLLMVCPVWGWFGCEAKNNVFLATLTFAAVVALSEAAWVRTKGWVFAAGLGVALAVWADFTSMLVIAPACGALLGKAGQREGLRDGSAVRARSAVLIALLIAAVAVAPLVLFKSGSVGLLLRGHIKFFHVWEMARLLMVWFPTGDALFPGWRGEWWWTALAVLPVAAPMGWLGVKVGLRGRRGPGEPMAARVVLMAIVGAFVLMWAGCEIGAMMDPKVYIYQPRNLLGVLPFFALLAAAGIRSLGGVRGRVLAAGAVTVMVASGMLAITVHKERRIMDFAPKGDWRAMCAWVDEHCPEGETPVVVSEDATLPVRYYLPGAIRMHVRFEDERMGGPIAEAIGAHRGAMSKGAVFVFVHDWWTPWAVERAEDVRTRWNVVEEARFSALTVMRLAE